MTRKPGQFVWYELLTTDVEAAETFYKKVVGWHVTPSGQAGMDYRLWRMGDAMISGLMAIPADAKAHGMAPVWLGYVSVENVDEAVAAVTRDGGSVRMPACDIPDVGRMALVVDPQGAAIYVIAPTGAAPSPSFAPGKPGHGGWHELHTTDWPKALAFYGKHFGWHESRAMDMGPMGTYLLFDAGGEAIGGMMNNPSVPQPMWLYYFCVDDISAAVVRIGAAGGTVLQGPHEVPGGSWIIQARDPQGAMFALVAPAKS
jgi:predicted enzyme related to lactoylglutathione lyase